eukprot:CAMPEP_0176205714 /NCGR_PEP_ID=MMETSP0121_2-20121125/11737_1 /TAXON_ID=160619 /ORGANISM="Kryptoperidinium foliaceum, Strain CCMP 1326" /LENGTH=119 /DNA_ID=CAMNT_0017544657 /DNA_START=102 /DNA_END=461 /DNA_ORIENTATION=+
MSRIHAGVRWCLLAALVHVSFAAKRGTSVDFDISLGTPGPAQRRALPAAAVASSAMEVGGDGHLGFFVEDDLAERLPIAGGLSGVTQRMPESDHADESDKEDEHEDDTPLAKRSGRVTV